MKTHKIFNLVFTFVFIFSLLGTPAPVFATSQTSIQSAPFTSCADVTEIPQAECEALVALYNSTDGAGWVTATNWLTTNMPCSWLGVYCGGSPSIHVTGLGLGNEHLNGSIPAELGDLTQLLYLNLWKNQLTGDIPPELGNLTQLQVLELGDNQLSGSIPTELGNLTQLTILKLFDNQLSGNIPVGFGNLTLLIGLYLQNNQLTGSIPPQLGNLTQLTELALGPNQLSGGIPAELGNLTQLTWLNLGMNQLSGSIPLEVGKLTQLTALYLNGNQLSGEFPASITNLVNLTTLRFDCGLTSSDPVVIAFLQQKSNDCFPDPFIIVQLEGNSVFAHYWPLGTLLMLEIDDPTTPQSPDYTDSQVFVGSENWENGFELEGVFEIQPGHLVTVSGGGFKKQLRVAPVTVTAVDIDADTVSGTGDPGFEIHVGRISDDDGSNEASRNIYVDSSGNWLADFATPVDPSQGVSGFGTYDIRLGSGTGVYEIDEDGDATSVGWNVPNHTFSVRANYDQVEGSEWILGSTITIEIDDPATQTNPDYANTATVGPADWDPSQTYFGINTEGYDLKLGDMVTVTDGDITKQLTVSNFMITDVNLNSDLVTGIASPGQRVNIWTCWQSDPCVDRDEIADQDGNWVTNFAVPGEQDWEQATADLRAGSWIDSSINDYDGDSTMFGWYVPSLPDPKADIDIYGNHVFASDWIVGSDVTVSFDIPGSDEEWDYGKTVTVPEGWGAWCQFQIDIDPAEFRIASGQVVRITDGTTTRQATIPDFSVTSEDPTADTISGIAPAGSTVDLVAVSWSGGSGDYQRHVVTDSSDGHWSADFAHPGTGSDEQGTLDVIPGTGFFWVSQPINDFVGIKFMWDFGPYFYVFPEEERIETYVWPIGANLTVTIDDPATPQNPDVTRTRENLAWQTNFEELGTILPGFTVIITDGIVTKTHVITDLAVTGADSQADIVTGTAEPDSMVDVEACGDNGCAFRHVRAGDDRIWLADFSEPDPMGNEQDLFDILPGSNDPVSQTDIDGDKTSLRWHAPNLPTFTLKGFYQPIDMNGVFNVVKGGSTVPFKFEIFADLTELTDIAYVTNFAFIPVACESNAPVDMIETTVIGGTSLRYDAASGQFIYNWKTPKVTNKCYRVTMTMIDGSSLVANFKLK